MICSFTQTYFNRLDLLRYQMNDRIVTLKNKLDLNIFSFHNSSKKIIDEFNAFNVVKNSLILEYNGIPYTHCIIASLKIIKKYDYLFWIQDDALSTSFLDYDKLLNSLHPNIFIALGFKKKNFTMKPLREENGMNIYQTQDFLKMGFFSLDDGPYIADTKIVREMYENSNWIKNSNVWSAETYNNGVWSKKKLEKYVLDKRAFININTRGPSSISANIKSMPGGEVAKRFLKMKFK